MRTFLLLACLAISASADDKVAGRHGDKVNDAAAANVTPSPAHPVTPSSSAAEKIFEIKDGDRVLFLGDTLLEREGTYGYLETRMVEQFPDRKFTVRNLAFSADTPLGWSRASFDPPAKGFERLKEQLALVKPTVVFLGYGMAASLQEMTDRSQDWTLNREPARYGAEPMSAARFKKELAQCMDAIVESAKGTGARGQGTGVRDQASEKGAPDGGQRASGSASGSAGFQPAVSGFQPETRPAPGAAADQKIVRPAGDARPSGLKPEEVAGSKPATAGSKPALPESVRFVLLSPIRHEDLRKIRPGLPDPTEHNKLLEQYSKAIEELAKERGARFVSIDVPDEYRRQLDDLNRITAAGGPTSPHEIGDIASRSSSTTSNGIHLSEDGYSGFADCVARSFGWVPVRGATGLRAAIIRKNALFFHRWRPANETYLFGFRKREQGQNAVEIPKFDPLIEAAEAEIEKLKKAPTGASAAPAPSIIATPSAIADGARRDSSGGPSRVNAGASVVYSAPSGVSPAPSGVATIPSGVSPAPSGMATISSGMPPAPSGVATISPGMPPAPSGTATISPGMSPAPSGADTIASGMATISPGVDTISSGETVPASISSLSGAESAVSGQKTAVLAVNDAPATGSQPTVTADPADPARQTPAETPDLAKVAASPSTLPLPTFTLADGLEISLWAENPLLAKPTECNWDAQGRLWVASSAMYPMIAPGQAATDKILVIEDPGHTGKGTKSTVFVDGLLLPTGVAPVLVQDGGERVSGRAGFQPAVPGILPGTSDVERPAQRDTPSENERKLTSDAPGRIPGAAGNIPALPEANAAPRWACYVGQSTELLYFEDTDGDGKADKKRIVFSGFGTEDTHHIVHTLRWGPDGRLYFSQSVYIHTHMETPWGVVRVNSGGVFAYDPRTERVEVVEKGLWNTWGHAWDQWGQSFYTDGAGSTGLSWGFPGATFAPNEGARRTMASISPGSYPKFAGLELIYSPHFPAEWQGSAVTCDFRAHKVVHFKINDLGEAEKSGRQGDKESGRKEPASVSPSPTLPLAHSSAKSGYITEQLPVLVQTSDATFRPIDVKLGPDGALYIADWSNPIINHGEVDFRDPRRDHEHGRIWRLSMKSGAAVKWESLVNTAPEKLLEKTTSPSLWESDQAGQLFIRDFSSENSAPLARAALDDVLRKSPPSLLLLKTLRFNQASLHPSFDGMAVGKLLRGRDGNLRAGTVPYFNPYVSSEMDKTIEDKAVVTEQDLDEAVFGHSMVAIIALTEPRTRIAAMRTLAHIPPLNALVPYPPIKSASLILDAAIKAPKDDPQYEFAAWLSINDLAEVWTKAVLAGEWKPEGREKQFEFALNAIEPALAGQVLSQFVSTGRAPLDGSGPWIELIGNTGGPGELRPLLDALLAATTPDGDNMKPLADAKWRFKTPDANRRAAAALLAAARRGVKPAGDAAGQLAPAAFFTHAPTDALPDVLRLAGLWKQNVPAAIFAALDTRASAPVLDAAFDALRALATPEAADFLSGYFDPAVEQKLNNASLRKVIAKSDHNWRSHALLALAPLRTGEALKHLDTVLAGTPEPQRVNVWRALFAEGPFMQKFMQTIPANFPPATAATALRAARELGRRGQPLAAKLAPLAGEKAATPTAPADYNDLAARAKKDGDPVAGEAIYRRMASACTTCHAIGGAGGKLGPDLTSIGASAPADYLIESILNPAAKVKEGYHAFSFKMKDGTEAIGIPSRETPQEQFIRTLAGEQGLPKANIVSKKIAESGASLMPAGLTAAWTDRERLNLYAFLMELGRPGPFDASKNNVARVWMLTDSEKVDGALKPEPASAVTALLPVYTLVDGRLTKDLLAEKLALLQPKNATVQLATRFQAASAGKAKLNLTGIRKAWLDGQPLAIASEPSPTIELTAGAHVFTAEVDTKSPPEVLRLESPAANFLGD